MTQASPSVRPAGYRYLVFALLAAGYFMVYFHRLCPSVVALDLMRDLNAGGALIGWLGSAYFYPYALMQLPAGLLSDSWGPRRTITVFFTLAGLASIGFALATSAGWAILARVLVGVGISMLFVPTMKVLTHWFRTEEFARMTGLLMVVGGAGALFATAPLAWLSTALGWRGSFAAIGVATLALAGAIWVLVRNTPEEKGLPPVEGAPAQAGAPDQAQRPVGLWRGVTMVLGARRFWPLSIWFFFTLGIFFSFGGLWGAPYLMQVHGMTKPQAGNVLSMVAWAMIFISPVWSWFSQKVVASRKKPLIGSSVVLIALVAILAFAGQSLSPAMLYVWFFLFSVVASAIVVVSFTMAKELFPVSMAGTAVGLVNLFPFLGGAVMQPVTGYLLERGGLDAAGAFPVESYTHVFLLYLASSVVALAASLFMTETMGRKVY